MKSFSSLNVSFVSLLASLALVVSSSLGQGVAEWDSTIVPTLPTGTPLVSTTPGDFAVNNSGAATYAMPLAIPAGRSGAPTPNLTLAYSSQGGNGVMGVGVSLSHGFPSAITRGRAIMARDGTMDPLDFDGNDRFYLDGKVLIFAGNNSSGESTYRTEVDSFVTITMKKDPSGETSGFVMVDKSGNSYYFGKLGSALDAYLSPAYGVGTGEKKAYSLALKRVVDPVGNQVDFSYAQRSGEAILATIEYGANTRLGIAAVARLRYVYDAISVAGSTFRPDRYVSNYAGRKVKETARLDVVVAETKVGSSYQVAGVHRFNYERSPDTRRTRMLSFDYFPRDPVSGALKTTSHTTLSWNPGSYATGVSYDLTTSSSPLPHWGDSDPNGANNPNRQGFNPFCYGDFDGDGKTDHVDSRYGLRVSLSNGSGFKTSSSWLDNTYMPANWTKTSLPSSNPGRYTGTVLPADLNGDGRTDLVLLNELARLYFVLAKVGGGFTTPVALGIPTGNYTGPAPANGDERGAFSSRITLADFTGDGCTDLILHGFDGKIHLFKWNLGSQSFSAPSVIGQGSPSTVTFNTTNWGNSPQYIYRVNELYISAFPCELNGDGIADYMWVEKMTQVVPNWDMCMMQPNAAIMTPQGTLGPIVGLPAFQTNINTSRQDFAHVFLTGDFTGDGLTDVMMMNSESNDSYALPPGSAPANRRNWMLYEAEGESPTGGPSFEFHQQAILEQFSAPNGEVLLSHFNPVQSLIWGNFDKSISDTGGDDNLRAVRAQLLSSLGEGVMALDVNRDGVDDVAWYVERNAAGNITSANSGWWVAYSHGNGFDAPTRLTQAPQGVITPSSISTNYSYLSYNASRGYDFNGDGFEDWTTTYDGVAASIKYSVPGYGDVVSGIQNGLGSTTTIAYKGAKDDRVYTPGAPVVYPIRDMRASNPVVSDVYKDSGGSTGGTFRYSYQYSGNRLDLSGRGSLGFHSFVTYDHQTDLLSYQFLAQSFPMTGLVKREQVFRSESVVVDAQGIVQSFDLLPVSSQDNDVTFDEVNVPGQQGLRGTLYPYMAHSQKLSWEYHAATPIPVAASNPESLFQQYNAAYADNQARAHSRVNTYVWFDSQNQSATPTGSLPFGFDDSPTYVPGQQDATAVGFTSWTVALQNVRNVSGSNHGKITDGNLRKTRIDYGEGKWEETVSTYYTSTPPLELASLLKDTQTTYGWTENVAKTQVTPKKIYTYWQCPGAVLGTMVQTALPSTEKIDAVDAKLDLETQYTRDSRGRVTETKIVGYSSAGADQHVGTYTVSKALAFDSRFDLPTQVEDAYQHKATTVYNPYTGQPISVIDDNGVSQTATYDALGRNLSLTEALLNRTTTTSYVADATVTVAPPSGIPGISCVSAYRVSTTSTLQSTVHRYYDRLGRMLRVRKEGYGTQVAVTDSIYDAQGRPVANSTVYPEGDTSQRFWTVTTYDELGRAKTTMAPNGTVTATTYHGRVTQISVDAPNFGGVNPAPQVTTTLVDVRGDTVKVWNADNVPTLSDSQGGYLGFGLVGESLRYDLDGMGRMKQTAMKGISQTVKVEYDELGNQTVLDDPDKGRWQYAYDALGRLRKQTNAKGDVTTIGYDQLNRKTFTKIDDRGDGICDSHARWFYYESGTKPDANVTVSTVAQGRWLGALQRSEIDYNPTASGIFGNAEHANSFTYNSQGLQRLNLHAVDGKHFYVYNDYDSYGRAKARDYQWRSQILEGDLQNATWNTYGVRYAYDSKSYVTTVNDTDGKTWWQENTGAGPKTYDVYDVPVYYQKGASSYGWTYKKFDPVDRSLESIRAGTSAQATGTTGSIQNWTYDWDGLGNLTKRTNTVQNGSSVGETFGYDGLNRLVTRNGASIATYQPSGNITWKKDVSGNAVSGYQYGSKPHAVSHASYTDGGLKNVDIVYDPDGNMIGRRVSNSVSGTIWSAGWTAFDKPVYISKQGVGSAFHYNADNQRVAQIEFDNVTSGVGHHTDKKLYVGTQMEVDYKNANSSGPADNWTLDRVRIYVDAPDGRTGAREWKADSTKKWYVYFQDHLGSVDAIIEHGQSTFATDPDGKQSKFSYDPWGERRDPTDWTGKPASTSGSDPKKILSPRGYTDHEMLDELGLVHMNGRIYDPLLGRFLSADAVVDGVSTLQGYNRYSYVKNNPLTLTDPTGYMGYYPGFENDVAAASKLVIQPVLNNPRVQGGIKTVAGAVEIGGGATMMAAPTGVTQVAGGVLIGHGADNMQAGIRQMISGKNTDTLTHDGIKAGAQLAGASESRAETIATVGDIAVGSVDVAIALPRLAKELPNLAKLADNAIQPKLANEIPERMARVVPGEHIDTPSLGTPGANEAWVTNAEDLAGITSSEGLAKKLTLVDESGNLIPGPRGVIEFDAPASGLATPINRTDPGFVGGGRTAGDAAEFVMPNVPVEDLENVTRRLVE